MGEKREGDRIEEKEGGRGTRNTMNTGINRNQRNQILIKNNILCVSYNPRFIEVKRDVTVKRRVAAVLCRLVDRFPFFFIF